MPTQSKAPGAYPFGIFDQPVMIPIGPTKPAVPIPEEIAAPLLRSWKIQVATGPKIAEVSTDAEEAPEKI